MRRTCLVGVAKASKCNFFYNRDKRRGGETALKRTGLLKMVWNLVCKSVRYTVGERDDASHKKRQLSSLEIMGDTN